MEYASVIYQLLRPRTVDTTASLRNVLKMLHNDVVESTARRRSGSQMARSRTSCARQFLLYT
eukprot:9324441-Lingulodinium_polyedra.AAC.1